MIACEIKAESNILTPDFVTNLFMIIHIIQKPSLNLKGLS